MLVRIDTFYRKTLEERGTGFVIYQSPEDDETYILTCRHVVVPHSVVKRREQLDVGQLEIKVNGDFQASAITGLDSLPGLPDLAVLLVKSDGLRNIEPGSLRAILEHDSGEIRTWRPGRDGGTVQETPYRHQVVSFQELEMRLRNDDQFPIAPGDSGAPFLDKSGRFVLGVVTKTFTDYRDENSDGRGHRNLIAVTPISRLQETWKNAPPELVALDDSFVFGAALDAESLHRLRRSGEKVKLRILLVKSDPPELFRESSQSLNTEAAAVQDAIARFTTSPLLRQCFDVSLFELRDRTSVTLRLSSDDSANDESALPIMDRFDLVVAILWLNLGKTDLVSWTYDQAIRAQLESNQPSVFLFHRDDKLNEFSDADDESRRTKAKGELLCVQQFLAARHLATRGGVYRKYAGNAFVHMFERKLDLFVAQAVENVLAKAPQPSRSDEIKERPDLNPYKGLEFYREEDFVWFFGRTEETNDLLKLLSRSDTPGFLAVVGASGSGKSSLIRAGLTHSLRLDAILGSSHWLVTELSIRKILEDEEPSRFLDAVFDRLIDKIPEELRPDRRPLRQALRFDSSQLENTARLILHGRPDSARLVILVDQFEEVFTQIENEEIQVQFLDFLVRATKCDQILVIVGVRSDFYHHCIRHPGLRELFKSGVYPLGMPSRASLYSIITRPALLHGYRFVDTDLPFRILQDAGGAAGMPLVSFAMEQLAAKCMEDGALTVEAYKSIGGLQGVIAKHAEDAVKSLETLPNQMSSDQIDDAMKVTFRQLVRVDKNDRPAKRMVRFDADAPGWTPEAKVLAAKLRDERLLQTDEGRIEIVHEALLTNWPRLETLIGKIRQSLMERERAEEAAEEFLRAKISHAMAAADCWSSSQQGQQPAAFREGDPVPAAAKRLLDNYGISLEKFSLGRSDQQDRLHQLSAWMHAEPDAFVKVFEDFVIDHQLRWPQERLEVAYAALRDLGIERATLDKSLQEFLIPENQYIVGELDEPACNHNRRKAIGERLNRLGDPRPGVGLWQDKPNLIWCYVPAGEVSIVADGGSYTLNVEPFYIAKFHLTVAQFKLFTVPREYFDPKWWQELDVNPTDYQPFQPELARYHPVEWATWFEAVAYTRWLSQRLEYSIRLPNEWEWQLAATGGWPDYVYPWGEEWDEQRANTQKAAMGLCAVGLYPLGASPVGALDMCGNAYEWCLNRFLIEGDAVASLSLKGDASVLRSTRGGAWFTASGKVEEAVKTTQRNGERPDGKQRTQLDRRIRVGIRLACSHPPSTALELHPSDIVPAN